MWMAWWRSRTARAAATHSGPMWISFAARWRGVLAHPNVSAAVILGLGCEVNQIDHYLGSAAPASRRLVGMTLQSSGGTRGTIEAAGARSRAFWSRRRPNRAYRFRLPNSCWD